MRIAAKPFEFRLDHASGVPVYRQLIDQVQGAIAAGRLNAGDQLPTIRKVAVDLAINPNTVSRSYRDLEQSGAVETQHGTGCFIAEQSAAPAGQTEARLRQFAKDVASRAGSSGLTLSQVVAELKKFENSNKGKEPHDAIED